MTMKNMLAAHSADTALFTLALLALFSLLGCTEEAAGVGTLRVSLSGEQGAKVGYPFTAEGETIAFGDGWSLTFDTVVVSVGGLRLRSAGGEESVLDVDDVVASLHTEDPLAWTFEGVPARRWDRVSYDMRVPSATARNVNGVSEATLTRMRALNAALYLAGTATPPTGTPITFELYLPDAIAVDRCVSGFDETDGVVVAPNTRNDVELTFHLDHFFFDSLASTAVMRFEAIAAAADAANHVTLDDLTRQDLSDLRDRADAPLVDEAGAPILYDPGSAPLAMPTLKEFIRANAHTVGHFNGEGHCDYTVE